jgi:site-specific recombinase XerD
MNDFIRPPVKVDCNKRVISDPKQRAHWWRLNVPASITGKAKERKFFKSEADAKRYAESLLEARAAIGTDLLRRLKARNMSVAAAIEYALRHAPRSTPCSVKDACKAFIESRRATNCKERYLANLKSQLDQFSEDFGVRMVDQVSKADVGRFLADLTGKDGETPASPKTRINFIITLTALFNYSVEEGWRGENPAENIRRPALDEVVTAILTPGDAAKLIEVGLLPANADIFPALLLQLFAGPRRSEIPHIRWDNIKDNYLRLDHTKVRQKRAVELPPALLEWLAPFAHLKGRVFSPGDVEFNPKDTRNVEDAYTYRLAQVAEEAKVDLTKNVLRHTAITYRDALTGDLQGTAAWAGNSPRVIEQHYRGAATKADALKFYAIRPAPSQNVVPIAGEAAG